MKNILFIDSCIHRENSRTEKLAQAYMQNFSDTRQFCVKSVILENCQLAPLNETVIAQRTAAADTGDFSSEIFDFARDFAAADELVIAAPYWDMSFPAVLKLYLEQICVCGLTFRYNEHGMPLGLTNIRKVSYFTTAGGWINNSDFGFDYIKGLFSTLFNITDIQKFSAEGLDIYGNDPDAIVNAAVAEIKIRTANR